MENLRKFGKLLKNYRRKAGLGASSFAENLDVDRSYISKLENGRERPSKNLLSKLSFLLSLSPEEVALLWTLSGKSYHGMVLENYSIDSAHGKEVIKEKMPTEQTNGGALPTAGSKPSFTIKLNSDQAIVYTDVAAINSNPYGLIINFGQTGGSSNEAVITTRVGMSIEHAKALLAALTDNIRKAEMKKAVKTGATN